MKKIVVTISRSGDNVEVVPSGLGDGCKAATQELERRLGTCSSSEFNDEYQEQSIVMNNEVKV